MVYVDKGVAEVHEQMDRDYADDELATMTRLKKEFAEFAESIQRYFQSSGIKNASAADVDLALGAMEDYLDGLLIETWCEHIEKGTGRLSNEISSFRRATVARATKPQARSDAFDIAKALHGALAYDSYLITPGSSMIGFKEWLAAKQRPVPTNPATPGAVS